MDKTSLTDSHLHMTVTTGEALYIIAQKTMDWTVSVTVSRERSSEEPLG
jgi:hypothetical protein